MIELSVAILVAVLVNLATGVVLVRRTLRLARSNDELRRVVAEERP